MLLETKDGSQPVQLVFVRNRRRESKKWLALITTDITLAADEAIRLYDKRWDIEVFFKAANPLRRLVQEFHGRSYDHVAAGHTTVVFLRYQLLAVAAQDASDPRTSGSLFWAMCDEVADLRVVEAWYLLIGTLREAVSEELNLTDGQVDHLLTFCWQPSRAPKTGHCRLRNLNN